MQVSTASASPVSQLAKRAHPLLAGRRRFRADATLVRTIALLSDSVFGAAPVVLAA
jgi:hypothetical protein